MNNIDGLISPFPKQFGHISVVVISISGRTRCRVICISPNLLKGKMLCLARSLAINSCILVISWLRCSPSVISIKSITIMPPMSRNLSCRVISSAAAEFTSHALFSCPASGFLDLLPLFTSPFHPTYSISKHNKNTGK